MYNSYPGSLAEGKTEAYVICRAPSTQTVYDREWRKANPEDPIFPADHTGGNPNTVVHRAIFKFSKPPVLPMKLTFRSQGAFRIGLDVKGSGQGGTLSRGVAGLRQKVGAALTAKRTLPSKANVLDEPNEQRRDLSAAHDLQVAKLSVTPEILELM